MGILKDLYFGKVYPFENIVPQDQEYYPLLKKIAEESAYITSKLPEADAGRFENYNNLVYQSEIMQNYASFEQGYRLGATLILESLTGKGSSAVLVENGEGEESITDILAMERLDGTFENLLNESKEFQEALISQEKAYKEVEAAKLNGNQEKAVDRLVSAVNHCGAMYGAVAYKRGLKDGANLSAELKRLA